MTLGLRSKIAEFGWPKRLALYTFLYAAYVLFAALVGPRIIQFVDNNYPGLFFYHLDPDESPGPIGDLELVLFSIIIDYILLAFIFVPFAIKVRMPLVLIFAVTVLNEPIIFICLIGWDAFFPIR
ncbi:hypothetical protein [Mesorhizobium sp. BH1-1-4]|uniref:hypothetical protein n=1 Tax=Mesorhizobium sp. BH1-1-4 TaxID=2876662 RepID=UPI001CD173F4|nr:hypothetical protein [Mesorhizobium sp. BH1-1-4]MBZ9997079.1 hypothetical protein [Mesorhizobium sp. BH1-1-4]